MRKGPTMIYEVVAKEVASTHEEGEGKTRTRRGLELERSVKNDQNNWE
jgi:hypothetical protein